MAVLFADLPEVESCRLVDFTDAQVYPSFVMGTYTLVVSGNKPYTNMKVDLVPRVYVEQPAYWSIEVVGCLSGMGLPAEASYTISIPLDGIRGTKGIEVVGATHSRTVPIGDFARGNPALNALLDLTEAPPSLYVHGSIIVYREDDKIEVSKVADQANPTILTLQINVVEGSGPMKGTPRHFCYKEQGEDTKTYTHVLLRHDEGQTQIVEVKVLT